MADAKSDYLEDLVLTTIFRTGPGGIRPASIWVALFSGNPTDTGGGGEEVSGVAYARVERANSDANWSDPATGPVQNIAAIAFAQAGDNWGTVDYFALFDAATVGNMLYYGQLTTPKPIDTGDQFAFQAGDLTIDES